MRVLILSAVTALFVTPLWAQTTADLAKEYIELPAVQDMFAAMFSPEASADQFAATLPPGAEFSEDQLQAVGAIMSEVLTGIQPQMEEMQVAAMADIFTAEELQAMIEFYSTDTGRSVLVKTQPMFAAVMSDLTPEIQAGMAERQNDITEILSE